MYYALKDNTETVLHRIENVRYKRKPFRFPQKKNNCFSNYCRIYKKKMNSYVKNKKTATKQLRFTLLITKLVFNKI